MKVIITGAKGMLATKLIEKLKQETQYELYSADSDTLDITQKEKVLDYTSKIQPDFIINCAAIANSETCEKEKELANQVNGEALEYLAQAANLNKATLIQISTDYVFDGSLELEKNYTEDAKAKPISAYGISKFLGEENTKKAKKYYILRTAWLYGEGKNFVRTMLQLSKTHKEVNVVSDQYGTPTSVRTLCDIILFIMQKQPQYGIYHATNDGFTSWYEFAKDIFEIANLDVKVNPVTTEEYNSIVNRPKNSKLSKDKLKAIGMELRDYKEEVKDYIEEELKK